MSGVHDAIALAALDVLPPEPVIEGDGFRELRHIGARAGGEPSAAGDWRRLFHVVKRPDFARAAGESQPEFSPNSLVPSLEW